MALASGTRLGIYEVVSLVGAGGMGEVYRARDTKLDRDVAIKILPDSFVHDAERLARFRREAQLLAQLNHPHIGAIYGLDETTGRQSLVLELVDGLTLADRVAQGPIPFDEAVTIATQIAEALEAAHEQGIVHRDLKPGNIKLRRDGVVKVLDFGLAKAVGTTASASGHDLAHSPTVTSPAMTGAGVILGTAAYMSPEQVRGRDVDKRSDVWAFGCVLYEMLTGRRAFQADDVSDTLASVLRSETDWHALPSDVPRGVCELIRGCLRKNPKERISHMSVPLFVLNQAHVNTESASVKRPLLPPVWGRAMLVLGSVVMAAALATIAWLLLRPVAEVPVTRLAFTLPDGQQLNVSRQVVALSPDGRRVVYAANGRLHLRSLSEFESRVIPGTEGGGSAGFSPDGQSLVFFAGTAIKRVDVGGGTAATVCQLSTAAPFGIVWDSTGILFSVGTAIMRVSAAGGKPEVVVDLTNTDDLAHGVQLLPDGDTLLFTLVKRTNAAMDRFDEGQIVLQSLKTRERRLLHESGIDARYVPTGHIVYASGGTMFAVPFNLSTLAVTGGAVSVVEGVRREVGSSAMSFAFSDSGSMVYVPGPLVTGRQGLVLFDRKGSREPLELPPGRYDFPRVSPDGQRVAFETMDGKEAAVSVYELSRTTSVRRLTFGGNNRFPIWSADGRRVTFQSTREGDSAIFWQPADGGAVERLTKPEQGASHTPESWSPDGDVLLFSATKDFVSSLWTFSLKQRTATPFGDVKDSAIPADAMFSPDGRWVAYQTRPSGMGEGDTYVQPFPPTGAKYLIAPGGRPLWSRDGKELFFVPAPGVFMAVTINTQPTFTFTNPVSLPRGFGVAIPSSPRTFDILPDGRFIGVAPPGQSPSGSSSAQIHVVIGWFDELKRRVPTT